MLAASTIREETTIGKEKLPPKSFDIRGSSFKSDRRNTGLCEGPHGAAFVESTRSNHCVKAMSTNAVTWALLIAPDLVALTWPPFTRMSVGMPRTP